MIVPKCCQDLIGTFISFHYNMLYIYVLLWKYYDNMKRYLITEIENMVNLSQL